MVKRKLVYLAISVISLLFVVSSCTCQNPLSGLSWGSATLRGQVISETKLDAGGYYFAGEEDVMIYTDVGNDFTYSHTSDEVNNPDATKRPKSDVDGRYLQVGEFEMKIRFRIGSTAKSKKITVYANKYNYSSQGSLSNILLVDGQPTIPVIIKVKSVE